MYQKLHEKITECEKQIHGARIQYMNGTYDKSTYLGIVEYWKKEENKWLDVFLDDDLVKMLDEVVRHDADMLALLDNANTTRSDV